MKICPYCCNIKMLQISFLVISLLIVRKPVSKGGTCTNSVFKPLNQDSSVPLLVWPTAGSGCAFNDVSYRVRYRKIKYPLSNFTFPSSLQNTGTRYFVLWSILWPFSSSGRWFHTLWVVLLPSKWQMAFKSPGSYCWWRFFSHIIRKGFGLKRRKSW